MAGATGYRVNCAPYMRLYGTCRCTVHAHATSSHLLHKPVHQILPMGFILIVDKGPDVVAEHALRTGIVDHQIQCCTCRSSTPAHLRVGRVSQPAYIVHRHMLWTGIYRTPAYVVHRHILCTGICYAPAYSVYRPIVHRHVIAKLLVIRQKGTYISSKGIKHCIYIYVSTRPFLIR